MGVNVVQGRFYSSNDGIIHYITRRQDVTFYPFESSYHKFKSDGSSDKEGVYIVCEEYPPSHHWVVLHNESIMNGHRITKVTGKAMTLDEARAYNQAIDDAIANWRWGVSAIATLKKKQIVTVSHMGTITTQELTDV